MTFEDWWKENEVLYKPLNVSKDVAKTIWSSAVSNYKIIESKPKRFTGLYS